MGVELANINDNEVMDTEEKMEDLEVDFSDSDLVSYVRQSLKSVALGDSDNYSELVGLLHDRKRFHPDDVALLVTSLKAISGAVSYIDSVHHETLLETVFSMSMWDYGPDVMDALVELIISLAASSGKYVDSCLDMLVSNFTPPFGKLQYLVYKKEQVSARVHSALECITGLVPLAPSRLLPIVVRRRPSVFQRRKEPEVAMFVENMFKLERSAIGELVGSRSLIMAVVDLLIDFDVEIGWDDILEENPSRGIFDMELEDELLLSDDEDGDGGEFPRELWGQKRTWKAEVADNLEKLDSLMVLTFEHLKLCKNSGRWVEVFESLLQSFQLTVLNAYKSKFAQFVIFYACSLDPENCGIRFAELLVDIFLNSKFSSLTRMSAVAYLASYLSRGRFLSTSFIAGILERLVQWCSDYCDIQSVEVNPKAHRVFYACSQAIMYTLCFHMRSIMDIPRLKAQLSVLPLRQILKNKLEPLKKDRFNLRYGRAAVISPAGYLTQTGQVCLPSIVEEFLRQAKSNRLLDGSGTPIFHDILESELSVAYGGIDRLDMFFPFDPCLLKRSDSYIRPHFMYWSMVRKTYEEDVEGSSDEDVDVFYPETNTVDPHDQGIAESFDEDGYLDDFNDSMNKMSITPKDSLLHKVGGQLRCSMQMPSRLRPSTSPP